MMMTIMILMMMIMTIMMMMMNRRKTSCLLACIFIHPIGIYVLIEDDIHAVWCCLMSQESSRDAG